MIFHRETVYCYCCSCFVVVVLCCVVLCCDVLCCVVLCCVVLCFWCYHIYLSFTIFFFFFRAWARIKHRPAFRFKLRRTESFSDIEHSHITVVVLLRQAPPAELQFDSKDCKSLKKSRMREGKHLLQGARRKDILSFQIRRTLRKDVKSSSTFR